MALGIIMKKVDKKVISAKRTIYEREEKFPKRLKYMKVIMKTVDHIFYNKRIPRQECETTDEITE